MPELLRNKLIYMREEEYARFNRKLILNIEPQLILGVRIPKLRKLAKSLTEKERACFLSSLPHVYHEENMLHALLINNISSPQLCIGRLNDFLPLVDNWAVCDSLRPKSLKMCPDMFLEALYRYLASGHTYTVRFAVEMLMMYFLDELFSPEYPEIVAAIDSDEYYVNMMISWYFATALAIRWDDVISFLEQKRLSLWVHNKTIQKAIESFRIDEARKTYLRTLKIKKKGA